MKREPCLLFFGLVGVCCLLAAPLAAQPVEVINEDFEDLAINGDLVNFAQIVDLGDGRGNILSLTQGANAQSGFAWFSDAFNLRDNKVTIDFDFWIRSGDSPVPADGMSVIFQFGNNTLLTGGGGGGLGTGGLAVDYVSVGFDIWDNRETNDAIDPPTRCVTPGEDPDTRSCHVEVNQNNNPGAEPSAQTNIDFGVEAPHFTDIGDQLIPIHTTIIFDNGAIEVLLDTEGDAEFEDPVTVLKTSLAEFPDPANAIVGFGASTGGANAHHEIDNLTVEIDDPTPRETVDVRLGDGDRGAINCGSTTEVTGTVGGETYTFVRDTAFGSFLATREDVVPVQDQFADYGHTAGGNPAGPADPPIPAANVGDENLQNMYQTERWMNGAVAYRFGVNNGRFEVNLHFAEICPACGVDLAGNALRWIHARVEGNEVLTHWSTALAAGEEAGTLPVARTAVVRTFQVDVVDNYLEVVISDLGLLGTPPENAQINGISYRRLGDATGAQVEGDIEYRGPAQLPAQAEIELVSTDFEDDTAGECPGDWSCNANPTEANPHPPVVVDFSDAHQLSVNSRLRLTDNGGGHGSTAIYTEPADLSRFDFEAEFDVYLTRDLFNANAPADGFTFFYAVGDESVLTAVGDTGGALAYGNIGAPGFAVEIDTWLGGTDPNGFNTDNFGHVALIVNGNVNQHVQHNIALDPGLVPPDWPLAPIDDLGDPENGQYLTGTFILEENETAGLHVEVSLNNDRFQVWLSTVNQESADGFVYPRTKVVDTLLSYGVGDLGEGYFGFSGATGGAVSWHEVDNVEITLIRNKDVRVARRIDPSVYSDSSTTIGVTLEVTVEPGTGPHTVDIVETLPPDWTATGITNDGAFAGGQVTWQLTDVGADTSVSFTLVPDDATRADVTLSGTFAVGGNTPLPIASTRLPWTPLPFCRGEGEAFISDNFDGVPDLECPPGWTCNGGGVGFFPFVPGVTQEAGFEGRLRLANESTDISSTAIWNTELDLTQNSFTAEFDVFFSNLGSTPADGLTFMILDASVDSPASLGAGGGSLGYAGLSGIAVELDLYEGAGDPSGYNTSGYAHIGVIRDGVVTAHVQTNVDFDPDLIPTTAGGAGWPNFVDQVSTGVPLHVEVDYNNGRIQVFLSADEVLPEPEFDRVQVIDTVVTFASGGVDPVLQTAYLGFSAATGGAFAYHEVDNVEVTTYSNTECDGEPRFTRGDSNADGSRNITDGVFIFSFLFTGGQEPPCKDAADTSDQGSINITSGIYILNFLFLGGPEPPAPFPDCGADPTPEGTELGCESFPPCE